MHPALIYDSKPALYTVHGGCMEAIAVVWFCLWTYQPYFLKNVWDMSGKICIRRGQSAQTVSWGLQGGHVTRSHTTAITTERFLFWNGKSSSQCLLGHLRQMLTWKNYWLGGRTMKGWVKKKTGEETQRLLSENKALLKQASRGLL